MNRHKRLRRYVRTPKGLLLVVLVVLTLIAARVEGFAFVAPGVLAATLSAVLIDLPATRWRRGRWHWPDGALITGVLIGAVLSSFEPWYVAAAAASVGIATKHVVRVGRANVFNPAALGLVVVFHLFDTAQNWWGALPAIVPQAGWPLLLGTGALVAYRVNKLPLALAFTATFFGLCTLATFVVDPADLAQLFVAPDLLAIVYFAGFMLTDPPTSATRARAQVAGGALVGTVSAAVCVWMGWADYLLVGLIAGNIVEAARRSVHTPTFV